MSTINLFKTSRLAFSEEFASKIYTFSNTYCREHFKVFREKWNTWQTEHKEELDNEIEKIQSTGIKNSIDEIKEKIYTSARFYFRKQSKQQEKKQKQNERKNNKREVKLPPISKTIKQTIEQFIQDKQQKIQNQKKPIEIYREYCETYIKEINHEINRLRQITQVHTLNPQEISLKFKKAFHNYLYRKYSIKNNE